MRRTILTETHNPIRLACTLAGILLWQAAQAHAPVPFDAVYEVRVDGKPRLEARITLVREGDAWKLSSTSSATRGLAKMLKVSTEEHSTGRWRDGRLEPLEYRHHTKVAGRDDRWSASFDWAKQVVTTSTEDGDFELPLGEDTTDPLSVTLVLGRHLASGAPEFTIGVLDEDEIDKHLYRASPPGPLQTELGCLEVVALERVRENSERYSTGWYASELGHVPVRVRHGKRGGREFDMRILRLELDGQAVAAREVCPD